ncbi:hypothetical protein TVVG_00046 [Tetraselmis viridis virus SI1]|uniref:hypothetical protein n=1 Tax=Tetraselmis viridis virus S20 TaxID=754070 RepID=UPI0002C14509|nr:hypothetical protein TVGG_00012 [Tetraselmis viridis virus S20]AGH31340.1 hypothetical protein TVGG_00012 [Tetraselmis viridis virus S20]AGH31428.1 hypothetical protein TVVG_00046 [Tetraselmis viridis virus SI1]
MAKKMGEESNTEDQTPGTDSDAGSNVTEATFLEACAEIAEQNRLVSAANERRKVIRKKWKANGITLGALDTILKMADWDREEVQDHFATRRKYAGWMGLPIAKDRDMFEGLSEDEFQRQEWEHKGLTQGLLNREPKPPEECPANMHQAFMTGFHKGQERRSESGARGTKAKAKPAGEKKAPAKKATAKKDAKADEKPADDGKPEAPKGGYRDAAAQQDAKAAEATAKGETATAAAETTH